MRFRSETMARAWRSPSPFSTLPAHCALPIRSEAVARAWRSPSRFCTLSGDLRATRLHTRPPGLERAYVVVTMLLTFETQKQFTVGTHRAGIQLVGISKSRTRRKLHTVRANRRGPGVSVVVLSPSWAGSIPHSPRSIGPIRWGRVTQMLVKAFCF